MLAIDHIWDIRTLNETLAIEKNKKQKNKKQEKPPTRFIKETNTYRFFACMYV